MELMKNICQFRKIINDKMFITATLIRSKCQEVQQSILVIFMRRIEKFRQCPVAQMQGICFATI